MCSLCPDPAAPPKLRVIVCASTQEPGGDWGVIPKAGNSTSLNATWGGVQGGVVKGDYEMSLSAWIWNVERNSVLSSAPAVSSRMQLLLTPKSPETDFGLFLRPFTSDAWSAIAAVLLVAIACVGLPFLLRHPAVEETEGHQIMVMTVWYFFVLLNAYYGGALTMFFSSEARVPFATIRDVIKAYPEWKLLGRISINANETVFISFGLCVVFALFCITY